MQRIVKVAAKLIRVIRSQNVSLEKSLPNDFLIVLRICTSLMHIKIEIMRKRLDVVM